MDKLPEKMLRDATEMRAFYRSVGISPGTTELAIKARQNKPVAEKVQKPKLSKGAKRKAAAQTSR